MLGLDGIAIQVSLIGSYRAPESRYVPELPPPPQTIISLPVQTAVWLSRACGTFAAVEVRCHVSVEGS